MGATFEDMIFMFQEEVAQRLVRDDAGEATIPTVAMSVRVHYYSKPYYIRPVSRHCFMPPPNVESCLIGFKPKEPHELLPSRARRNSSSPLSRRVSRQKAQNVAQQFKGGMRRRHDGSGV